MNQLKILIIDDEKRVRDELDEFLTNNNYIVFQSGFPSEAFEIMKQNNIDIVILDIRLPEMDGLEVLEKIKKLFPDIEVIMITGHGDMNSVIHAMRSGAFDYLTKPISAIDVQNSIERTRKFITLNKRLKTVELNCTFLSRELQESIGYHIIGNSPEIRYVIDLMGKVAKADDAAVLITGESGTGKELVARGIHYLSPRKNNYFYPVNIATIPDNLFESEFFGHKKGAFTDAKVDKSGWFEVAHNSTLFMDEICELNMRLQAKLLRVLEEKKVIKIGSRQERRTDVRIISATNKNIRELVKKNRFRADLYHRINTFEIYIPPLRRRKSDIPLLLENFVNFYSGKMNKPITGIDKQVINYLLAYDFPGNVRELKNMAERAVILCEEDILYPKHFPTINMTEDNGYIENNNTFDLEIVEKNLIKKALIKTKYNKLKASKLLNISWQALDRRIKKYDLEQFFKSS